MKKSLQEALRQVQSPAELPWPLPMAHLTVARWFQTIVADASLTPRDCKVFGQKLLYLSYGGVFYRPKDLQTQDSTELPIAFLFSPDIADQIAVAYPFDTGAMKAGRFGDPWTAEFASFKDELRVVPDGDSMTISNLVHYLWGSNRDYLRGIPNPTSGSRPEPFASLCRFFAADLSSSGVDHRQRAIECISTTELIMDRKLMWVGYPNILGKDFVNLCKRTRPWIPESHAYDYHRNFNPARLAETLEHEAARYVERFVSPP